MGIRILASQQKNLETIVVQRLGAKVSGKDQKNSRVGAREFVSFEDFD